MKLRFQLRFHTQPGQTLWLKGNHPLLGGGQTDHPLPLQYQNDKIWELALPLPNGPLPDTELTYDYLLRQPDGSWIEDWGKDRKFNPARFQTEDLLLVDSWNYAGFYENVFYTEPFKEILLKPNRTDTPAQPAATSSAQRWTHLFRVRAPLLHKGQTLCLLGNQPLLTDWNTQSPLLLRRDGDYFQLHLDLTHARFPLAYKYSVYDLPQRRFLRYEDGPNRELSDSVAPGKQTVVNDGFVVLPANTWKGAGVALPVFSLRTEKSFGVGEFSDLKLMSDWCKATGLKLLQILPVNDTTATYGWRDSYPYSAISAFALHPVYLNLSEIISERSASILTALEPERRRLNALPSLDYVAVIKAKLDALKKIYPLERDKIFKSTRYRAFFKSNQHWLVPYAAFCVLRDRYGTSDVSQWPEHSRYDEKAIAKLAAKGSPVYDQVAFHYFLQFHLHLQLHQATEYAHRNGVILKGDIAIGVARHGADTWQAPELFHLEFQAGAPPDAFAAKGQNWSFPTYNWPRMKESGFAWWKQRFAQMSEYFDAFRIDHVLGFFRIWSIPVDAVEGILGRFVPALPVRPEEFLQRGIAFDHDRFTQPYITDAVLTALFGSDHESVRQQFLTQTRPGVYQLRPEFSTQRKVEAYFAGQPPSASNAKLQEGLFDLISNVILFQSAPGEYHFRLALETTSSFRHLDPDTRERVRALQLDYFFRRQEDRWREEALQKLPPLKRVTNMLICGEDLGMVPDCVPGVMKDLGLLGLEVQRMPKSQHQEFSRPADAPYLSIVTPGTHDMSTLRGWWLEDRQVTQRFYNQELALPGSAPAECDPSLNQRIIEQHLASPAQWSIFQLQDLLGMDAQLRHPDPSAERINVPADVKNQWRYRMHLTVEHLQAASPFNANLRHLLETHGRA